GLRWKKDRSQSDVALSTSNMADGRNGHDTGGINQRTEADGLGIQPKSTGDDQAHRPQERSAVDVSAEDVSSAAKHGIDESMFTALKDLFWSMSTRMQRTGSMSPQSFVTKLKEGNELFRSNAHQDAHEFLNYLLNEIVENVEKIHKDKGLEGCTGAPLDGPNRLRGSTWVHTLFEGLLTNETRCLSCENVTSRDETILDVSVDIHENTSVTNCLNQFAAGELLCHNNKFYCDNCGGLQEAERRMRLKRLPNILALHLKRFKYHEGLGRYVKLSYRVNFPTELRVPNTTEETEDVLYSLSAIVVHLGGGPFHGHYISIVRSGDKWVLFDDDCVDIIKENELLNYFGDMPNFGSGYLEEPAIAPQQPIGAPNDQVNVQVVNERGSSDGDGSMSAASGQIARPRSDFQFPFSGQPDIVRSTQKDAFYQQRLNFQLGELVQQIRGTRYYSSHQEQVDAASKLVYYGLTTLAGAQTLGEEYCGILQVDKHSLYPSLGRRLLMVVLHAGGGFGILRILAATRAWLQKKRLRKGKMKPGAAESGLEKLSTWAKHTDILCTISMAHLAVFYFTGAYYNISKRLAGVRYVFTRKLRQGEENSGYEILGALLGIQLTVQTAMQMWNWQTKADSTGDGEETGASDADEDDGRVDPKDIRWSTAVTSEDDIATAEEQASHDSDSDSDGDSDNGSGNDNTDGDGTKEECVKDHGSTLETPDRGEKTDKHDALSAEDFDTITRFTSSEQKCTLCLSPRAHSASTPCGHLFCWNCAFEWCQTRPECPLCRQPVKLSQILPVYNY
ncbi:hypothetical protein GGI12_004152, partial [Dipsacomyces acuminosporus]